MLNFYKNTSFFFLLSPLVEPMVGLVVTGLQERVAFWGNIVSIATGRSYLHEFGVTFQEKA